MPESTLQPGRTRQTTAIERRAWVRYQCSREACYSSLPSYERFWATVQNISVDGIGLVVSAPIEPGTYLVVEMQTTSRPIYLTMLARVIHAVEQAEGGWAVGCELITKPTQEQLQALL